MSFEVGQDVVIVRKGLPWKRTVVLNVQGNVVVVQSGFRYDAHTGRRLGATSEGTSADLLEPLDAESAALLEVRAFLARAGRVSLREVPRSRWVKLAELVRALDEALTPPR